MMGFQSGTVSDARHTPTFKDDRGDQFVVRCADGDFQDIRYP